LITYQRHAERDCAEHERAGAAEQGHDQGEAHAEERGQGGMGDEADAAAARIKDHVAFWHGVQVIAAPNPGEGEWS
jgi:hypothetical protein